MNVGLLSSIFLVSLTLSMSASQTVREVNEPTASVLNTAIPDFFLADQTIFDGVSELNSEPVPLAFGFENVLKVKFDDPPIPDPLIDVTLQDATVKEILDALCKADPRYTWSLDGSTVNIYPRGTNNDPSYLLNRRLEKLEIKNITDISDGLLAIAEQLAPPLEQIAHAQVGGDTTYPPQPWTATFEKLTVRQAANRLAGHMGAHSAWFFHGSRDFRAFAFYRLGFRKPTR
jgi:hypothetical protein